MASNMEQIQQQLERAQSYVLAKLPEDRQSRIFLPGGVASVAGVVLLPLLYHAFLGRQISHTYPNASARFAALEISEISCLPKDVVENGHSYRVAHDKVVKRVDLVLMLSEKMEQRFTKLLRRNMTAFSRLPQGWLLWFSLNTPEQRRTFTRDHIESLDFKEGDVVCGMYHVAKRTALRVEMEMQAPKALGSVSGLLVISLRPRNDGAALVSETIQWTKKDSGAILPLERWIGGFLHSVASRWLVITGAAYLRGLGGPQ